MWTWIIALAWGYVVLLMAVAEATSPRGSVLGAFFTLLLYGALPMVLLLYILGTPARKRALRAAERSSAAAPDGGGQAPGVAVAPEREEP